MIFVLLEGNDVEGKIKVMLGDLLLEFVSYNIENIVFFDLRQGKRECNYKFIIDGFCEFYYFVVLYKKFIVLYFYVFFVLIDGFGDIV